MLVSPGVSPINGQNPGVATFEVDSETLDPQNLELHFLRLELTYGWEVLPKDIASYPFRSVSLSNQFGLYQLTGASLKQFKSVLESKQSFTEKFLISKIGFDPNDNSEFKRGMDIYINDIEIVTANKQKLYKFICQMHMNKDSKELAQCVTDAKGFLALE